MLPAPVRPLPPPGASPHYGFRRAWRASTITNSSVAPFGLVDLATRAPARRSSERFAGRAGRSPRNAPQKTLSFLHELLRPPLAGPG